MIPTPTPPPGLSVITPQQQRANELAKIAKTQIVFKIGGLTEENFAYAQQEIQAVDTLFLSLLMLIEPSLMSSFDPRSSAKTLVIPISFTFNV